MTADGASQGDVAAAQVNLKAQGSAARKAAERGANVDMGAYELDAFGDQVLDAAKSVGNAKFVPWNVLANTANENISDPNLARYKASINGAIGAYAQVLARNGTPTVEGLRIGQETLNKQQSYAAVAATIKQWQLEAKTIRASSGAVQQNIHNSISGGSTESPTPLVSSGAATQAVKTPGQLAPGKYQWTLDKGIHQ